MKRYLVLILALFAATASATDLRNWRNRSSGGKECAQVNVAGVMTDLLCLNGTTSAVTIGAPATGNYTGFPHIVSGSLFGGNVTSNDASGELIIGVNAKVGGNTAQANRTTTGTTGGSALVLDNRTADNVNVISFWTNLVADGLSTTGSVIASATQAGLWSFGGVGNNPGYKTYALTTATLTTSNVLVTPDSTVGGWTIAADCLNGGIQMFGTFRIEVGLENGVTARCSAYGSAAASALGVGNGTITESSECTYDLTLTGLSSVLRFIWATSSNGLNVRTVSGTITTCHFRFHNMF